MRKEKRGEFLVEERERGGLCTMGVLCVVIFCIAWHSLALGVRRHTIAEVIYVRIGGVEPNFGEMRSSTLLHNDSMAWGAHCTA